MKRIIVKGKKGGENQDLGTFSSFLNLIKNHKFSFSADFFTDSQLLTKSTWDVTWPDFCSRNNHHHHEGRPGIVMHAPSSSKHTKSPKNFQLTHTKKVLKKVVLFSEGQVPRRGSMHSNSHTLFDMVYKFYCMVISNGGGTDMTGLEEKRGGCYHHIRRTGVG